MECLILRLDAPLMSFGGVTVDQRNPTDRFPALSMLTGLIANALGLNHSDFLELSALQSRIRFAARWDVPPVMITDYHTVDLGQDFMMDTGWTTRGEREDRKGGEATYGTHIRERYYLANGVMTIALTLSEGQPSIEEVANALLSPARPLFIGRKSCLPSARILVDRVSSKGLRPALEKSPLSPRAAHDAPLQACWPSEEDDGTEVEVYDVRDWKNQMHTGSRIMSTGYLKVSS